MTGGYTPVNIPIMPGQRKQGKKQVAVWLTMEEKVVLHELAQASGKTMSEILKERLNEHIQKRKSKNK